MNNENQDKKWDYQIKIILLGSCGTGKTNFISKICRNQFDIESHSTIGIEFGVRDVIVESHLFRLQLWDTAGQEKFLSMTSGYFKNAAGVFLLYDITKKDSFDQIQTWLKMCKQYLDQYCVLYLVGNKIDMQYLREVNRSSGQSFAQVNQLLFEECSAASGEKIEDILKEMVSNIYQILMMNEIQVENPQSKSSLSIKSSQNTLNSCCI
ncbi:unnamed protein product (macronuclear) [Paramecium tetraurelia]|uniref:Chromosome undetermined scaffold_43, whole genome shotgun sequence n=1 Tax=Paramecium tetraurelia TaxID=5888 RepID=Q3SD69_PARTE|nr:uncharacterized protein GSPATT00014881001 [Paramecium tetraurelia]CAI44496.1 rab_C44 [Paramecium tetraurelia]CAK79974.1 unnamed protein product [Paramecium tetraurelia]|eukprot:XP_001447371.1 hypothetical protein (macronuclear) [Paramecium tetraurelia strain d4-2]